MVTEEEYNPLPKSSNYSNTSPSLSKDKNYQDWLKLIKIWRNVSDLPKAKQQSAMILSLENKFLDAVLGVHTIINILDRIYKTMKH